MTLRRLLSLTALVAACWLIGAALTRGQNSRAADAELEALDQKIKQFLQTTIDDDVHAAFQELLAGSPLARQTEAVTSLEQKTRELQARYGLCRNVEQVSAKRVGRDLVLMKYLYNCESFPVVWYFTYYRVYKRGEVPRENSWAVVAVRFDTDLELLALTE
jgi:hypothetical protein